MVHEPKVVTVELNPVKALEGVVIQTNAIPCKSYVKTANVTTVGGMKELLKAACCNLSQEFETNPSIDI